MLKKSLEWVIPLTLADLIAGCATYRPPEQIQSATSTLTVTRRNMSGRQTRL